MSKGQGQGWKQEAVAVLHNVSAVLVYGPLIVGCWRGAWNLMDQHGSYFPELRTFFVTGLAHLSFVLVRDGLTNAFAGPDRPVCRKACVQTVRVLYTYLFAVICILFWRSLWSLVDSVGTRQDVLKLGAASVLALALLKSVNNAAGPPTASSGDSDEGIFYFPTRFNTKSTDRFVLYLLDSLFSVFVIGSLVVFVWRGAWVLFDMCLYPAHPVASSWTSLALGYAVVAITFALQPLLRRLCAKLTGLPRIALADLYVFFSIVGTINVWRGIWNLLDIYFLPDRPELSCWITHLVCLSSLILLNCSNSLLVRGVYIDAEEPAGKCVVFPCYYLRLIFKNDRLKKQAHELERLRSVGGAGGNGAPCSCTCACTCPDQNLRVLLAQNAKANHVEV